MYAIGDVVRLLAGPLKNEIHVIQKVRIAWNNQPQYLIAWSWCYEQNFTPCDTPLFVCLWIPPDLTAWKAFLLPPDATSPVDHISSCKYRSDLEDEILSLYPDASIINYVELQILVHRRNHK